MSRRSMTQDDFKRIYRIARERGMGLEDRDSMVKEATGIRSHMNASRASVLNHFAKMRRCGEKHHPLVVRAFVRRQERPNLP